MLRNSISLIFIICLFLLTSCLQVSVRTHYKEATDFHKYKSFKFIEEMPWSNNLTNCSEKPLIIFLIGNSIKDALMKRGYKYIESGNADIEVSFHIRSKHMRYLQHYGYHDGYEYRFIGKRERTYEKNILVIYFCDTKLEKLIWVSYSSGIINQYKKTDKNINDAITTVLNKFPPD